MKNSNELSDQKRVLALPSYFEIHKIKDLHHMKKCTDGQKLGATLQLQTVQRRIQTGARGERAPTSRKEKERSLIFFCAPARNLQRGTQQANVRKQRLVNARTSVPHGNSSIVSDVYIIGV